MVSLHCGVCSDVLGGKEGWLCHLLEDNHQRKGREELVKRCLQKDYAKMLVVYSNESVASGQLLQHFSKDMETLVTDFVWWPERVKVGFMQFESKEKVEEILNAVGREEVCVGDLLIQVRPATDIRFLEWGTLLPLSPEAYNRKRKGDSNNEVLEPNSSVQVSKVAKSNAEPFPQSLCQPPAALTAMKKPNLVYHIVLMEILKTLEVTESEYQTVQLIREELQKIFDEKVNHVVSVGLIQTWSLKLKQAEKDCGPFFIIQRKSRKNSYAMVMMDNSAIRGRILNDSKSTLSKELKELSVSVNGKSTEQFQFPFLFYQFKKSNEACISFKITGITSHRSKIWEMMNYLSQFNPICKPLLAVIYHWANANLIQVVGELLDNPKSDHSDKYFILTLLAFLFLSAKGHIPKFIDILDQTQNSDRLYCRKINIGFTENSKYVSSWRKERGIVDPNDEDKTLSKKVFVVASRFFLHYGNTLVRGEWIINSENGKMYKPKKIRSYPYPKCGETSFKKVEFARLKKALSNQKAGQDRIFLTHPFSTIQWLVKISTDPTPFKKMQKTGMKLANFLNATCGKNLSIEIEGLAEMLVI